jgi:hypothetical protein
MRDEQIRPPCDGRELRVRLGELGHQQLADDHLRAAPLVHHAFIERLVVRVEIGPYMCVLDACALNLLAIDFGSRDDGRMAARLEREREADVREEVAVRAPAVDDDTRQPPTTKFTIRPRT